MDYERKYKEALERARIWKEKSGMPKDKQGILNHIFPELRESEDEGIRKDLIGFFKDESFLCHKKEDILAWLEKQVEQKPQRMISAEAKEALYDKPTWSEEDERIFSEIILRCEKYGNQEQIDWLKSLKQRIGG